MIKSLFFRPHSKRRRGRFSDYVVTLGIFGLVALVVAYLNRFEEPRIGAAVVADGDTIVIDGERIRLRGMDAPEFDQICSKSETDYACGRMARDYLKNLIGRQSVSCSGNDRDRYNRLLGTCQAGGVDINKSMVEAGWAVSFGDYFAEEDVARKDRLGMWAGRFDRPQSWRSAHGRMEEDGQELLAMIGLWLRRFFGFANPGEVNPAN